jgi:hypothetical protein
MSLRRVLRILFSRSPSNQTPRLKSKTSNPFYRRDNDLSVNITAKFLIDIKGVTFVWDKDFFAFDSLGCEGVVEFSYVVCGEDVVGGADGLVGWWVGDFLAELEGAWKCKLLILDWDI